MPAPASSWQSELPSKAAHCLSVLMTPGWAPVASCISGRVSKSSTWVWLTLLSNDYLCAGTWGVRDCAYALEEGSLFPTAFLPSCTQGLLGFKVTSSRGSSFQCRILGWGDKCVVLTHCSLGRTSEVLNTLSFVGRLLWMWVLVLLSPLLLPICGSFCL